MKLGIKQPYFFPHLGYFDLINYSDEWVIFDTVQYIRKGWMNRNRILHPTKGWQYVGVPIRKHRRNTVISDIRIDDTTDWRLKILNQIQHYRKAPYFTQTCDLVSHCLNVEEENLGMLNGTILREVCKYLGIPFSCRYYSEMDLSVGHIGGPGDWALRISDTLGASEYVDSSGIVGYFDPLEFESLGIGLTILDKPPMEYAPRGYKFVPRLSIIDVLMWNLPEQVMEYLNR